MILSYWVACSVIASLTTFKAAFGSPQGPCTFLMLFNCLTLLWSGSNCLIDSVAALSPSFPEKVSNYKNLSDYIFGNNFRLLFSGK